MILLMSIFGFVSATYVVDIYFTLPDTIFVTGEQISLKGYVYQANFTAGASTNESLALASASVNLTITNTNGTYYSNYTLTTDANGTFYSRSNFNSAANLVSAPLIAGEYYIRTEYIDPENVTFYSEVEINVVNQTVDIVRISPDKAVYNPSEAMKVNIEAVKLIGDRTLYIANISVNGSLRNSTKYSLNTFNCTTGINGKCSLALTAPADYGNYFVEAEDFKTFSSFSVVPFSFNIYMKDEFGQSLKNIFAVGEQARIEVKVSNASASDVYTFSGYIMDSGGNVKKAVTSTILNNNNSFTNSFLFTVDSLTFGYDSYTASITVAKSGDGSIASQTSFQVKDWILTVDKKTENSGFEYEYSSFPNQTLWFETTPTYRSNGSVIAGLNSSSFTINLKDNLNNILSSGTALWNSSCNTNGCYEFNLTSPLNASRYVLSVALSYSGAVQMENRIINVVDGVLSGQSSDREGNLKELFGTNEYVYLSLDAYNITDSTFNLSDAEVFLVSYMNGSEFSYTSVTNFSSVNANNSIYEWAWNSTLQRIKMDVPRAGGLYDIFVFGNNRTLGTELKFIVNPYDFCSAAKDTPGEAGGVTGYYYVWQFKTTDTVYFDLKLTQANNPLGKASASNLTSSNSSGMGAQCNVDTSTKQVVSNATITVLEVKNLESGAIQGLNVTESTCYASDTSGGYTCTVKPLDKWEGGINIVKFNVQGPDGTTSIAYSRFESRAFYLYGWSQSYQNNPDSNVTLSLQLYEAGKGWWSTGGYSGGLSGTVIVKKIEYQGRDGEWLYPPVDSGYNVSRLNSSSITTGYQSTGIPLPVTYASGGVWKTGYYRVILQATTTSGDVDYGYAYFSVKLWDVYGQPMECTDVSCNYKNYFNSKENITLYVTINKAGTDWWSSSSGGQDIYGNVSVGIKKIENCRTWPCKQMNASEYSASSINVNASSPGYWYSGVNLSSVGNYIIQINSTSGTWGTGYYSVTLDVNGTDTGYAWFNTIAFYVESQPSNVTGSYQYSIKGNQQMYFNVTTTKSYKNQASYWNGSAYVNFRYNESDYLNVTFDDAVLRTWDSVTYQSIEYNYPEDINISPSEMNGNTLVNVTFLNGTWPTGYYYGELTLKNVDNETSTGWIWFDVKPFRINSYLLGSYNVDSESCVNATISVYEPSWSYSIPLYSNYSIDTVYEEVWNGPTSSRTNYDNYSINGVLNSTFNSSANITVCPNDGKWEGGNWGGYHYLSLLIRDNTDNSTQIGWINFRTVPFTVSWGTYSGNVFTTSPVNISVALSKPIGGSAVGNLTNIYQWRYDTSYNGQENYVFKVVNGSSTCYSNVSSQCTINGSAIVTIYPSSLRGWRMGYNYLQAGWISSIDSDLQVQDSSGVYFEGKSVYNGYFSNYNSTGDYKYDFAQTDDIIIKLFVRDADYNSAGSVTITGVDYAYSGSSCWDDSCRTYSSATFSPTSTEESDGSAVLTMTKPSGGWTRGIYAIRATVSGAGGETTITGGSVRVKDFTAPVITLTIPQNNVTYNNSLTFSATTTEDAQCSIYIINYDNFYIWNCGAFNSTNSTNSTNFTDQTIEACNFTKYGYNGSDYHYDYVSSNYHSSYDGSNSTYCYDSSGVQCYSSPAGLNTSTLRTFLTTGTTSHTYILNTSEFPAQDYGMQMWCYDDDYNYVTELAAFKINNTLS